MTGLWHCHNCGAEFLMPGDVEYCTKCTGWVEQIEDEETVAALVKIFEEKNGGKEAIFLRYSETKGEDDEYEIEEDEEEDDEDGEGEE